MRFLNPQMREIVARNDIVLNGDIMARKRDILDYLGTLIFCLLSYYILSMDKFL